jgi:hypothetical protein
MPPLSDTKVILVGRGGVGGNSHLKFRVILVVLTLLNPNMTSKLPYHPPELGEGIKLKNYVCSKKRVMYCF